MISRAQKVRLGVFLTVGGSLLLIIIFLIAGQKLMEKRDKYYVVYQDYSVMGLQVGGAVKFHGIAIGRVEDIRIDPDSISHVIVDFSVKRGTPVKSDMEARLVFQGITGLKQVELTGGTDGSATLVPGSQVKAGYSVIDNLSGQAEVLVFKIEQLVSNLNEITGEANRQNLASMLANGSGLLTDNREHVASIIAQTDSVARNMAAISRDLNRTVKKVNALMQSGQVDQILDNTQSITAQIKNAHVDSVLVDVRHTVNNANAFFTHADLTLLRARPDLLRIMQTMKEATDYLYEFTRQISDDPRTLIFKENKQAEDQ